MNASRTKPTIFSRITPAGHASRADAGTKTGVKGQAPCGASNTIFTHPDMGESVD